VKRFHRKRKAPATRSNPVKIQKKERVSEKWGPKQFYLQIFDIQSKYNMYPDCLQIKGLRLPSGSTTAVSLLTKYDPSVQYITY
jgi:hypothetical protein